MKSLSDFFGFSWDRMTPEQMENLEREIIKEWQDHEDALIIRDIQNIVGETK